jgi:hypothetical protein
MAWTKVAIRDGIKGALPEHVRHLEEIGQTAQDIVEQLGKLDSALKAENRAGYRLSVVQTLFGTFIGLVGGFANDWIDKGGIGRILAALGIGLLLVLAGPPLTIGLYNTLRKSPMQAPGGEKGISDEAGEGDSGHPHLITKAPGEADGRALLPTPGVLSPAPAWERECFGCLEF